MDSVILGLNNTSSFSAHEAIFARSWLRVFDALSGESTIICRLVLSAIFFIFEGGYSYLTNACMRCVDEKKAFAFQARSK